MTHPFSAYRRRRALQTYAELSTADRTFEVIVQPRMRTTMFRVHSIGGVVVGIRRPGAVVVGGIGIVVARQDDAESLAIG